MALPHIFPHPLLSFALWVVWLLLNNTTAMGHVVLGGFLAILIPWMTSSFWPEKVLIRRPWLLLKYVVVVLFDILVSNLVVTKLILGRSSNLNPGFIQYELQLKSPVGIGLLANTISLTPGTVSCDLSEDRRFLLIHSLHIEDVATIKADIHRKFERPLKEIFASC
jgi:multicomponent K+:H+ antiporter subunit E